jgi:hypothetical protein
MFKVLADLDYSFYTTEIPPYLPDPRPRIQ